MHQRRLIGICSAILGLSAVGGSAAAAQHYPSDALAAVDEVIAYRRDVLDDSLPFDACSVYERTGRPADMLRRIRPPLRPLLDRPSDRPCEQATPPARPGTVRIVKVDSVVTTDSMAYVHLSILREELHHRETYYLPVRRGGGWGVREVRIWGAIQFHPGRPRASAGDGGAVP